MPHHYGYILRHESEADGDHVDLFMGPHPDSDVVFVVDQQTPGGRFDEHKVMAGFISERKAREGYLASYSPGWKGLRSITAMTVGQFLEWLESGETGKPVEDQVSRYAKKAPKGGMTIGGEHFKGGQFIPNEVVKSGTESQQEAIEDKVDSSGGGMTLPRGMSLGGPAEIAGLAGRLNEIPGNQRVGIQYGIVDDEEAKQLKGATGLNLKGYFRVVDSMSMRHSLNRHGKDNPKDFGQIPITLEDFAKIPEIVSTPDSVRLDNETTGTGSPVIIYEKRFNGTTIVVEEVRTGKRQLALKSMRKRKSVSGMAPESPSSDRPKRSDTIDRMQEFSIDEDSTEDKEKYAKSRKSADGQKELEWITIGGAAEDDKKHAGGTPVLVDGQGRIHGGPDALTGKTLGELDKDKAGTEEDGRNEGEPPSQQSTKAATATASDVRSKLLDELRTGRHMSLRELQDAAGHGRHDPNDPAKHPVNSALMALRDSGEISVHEPRRGEPSFWMTDEQIAAVGEGNIVRKLPLPSRNTRWQT